MVISTGFVISTEGKSLGPRRFEISACGQDDRLARSGSRDHGGLTSLHKSPASAQKKPWRTRVFKLVAAEHQPKTQG